MPYEGGQAESGRGPLTQAGRVREGRLPREDMQVVTQGARLEEGGQRDQVAGAGVGRGLLEMS